MKILFDNLDGLKKHFPKLYEFMIKNKTITNLLIIFICIIVPFFALYMNINKKNYINLSNIIFLFIIFFSIYIIYSYKKFIKKEKKQEQKKSLERWMELLSQDYNTYKVIKLECEKCKKLIDYLNNKYLIQQPKEKNILCPYCDYKNDKNKILETLKLQKNQFQKYLEQKDFNEPYNAFHWIRQIYENEHEYIYYHHINNTKHSGIIRHLYIHEIRDYFEKLGINIDNPNLNTIILDYNYE